MRKHNKNTTTTSKDDNQSNGKNYFETFNTRVDTPTTQRNRLSRIVRRLHLPKGRNRNRRTATATAKSDNRRKHKIAFASLPHSAATQTTSSHSYQNDTGTTCHLLNAFGSYRSQGRRELHLNNDILTTTGHESFIAFAFGEAEIKQTHHHHRSKSQQQQRQKQISHLCPPRRHLNHPKPPLPTNRLAPSTTVRQYSQQKHHHLHQ